jgi:acyl-CoA synthetase (NDP forming)
MTPYIQCLEALIAWEKVDAVISLSGNAGPLAHLLPDVKKKAEGILPSEKTDKIAQQVSEGGARIYERVCELVEKHRKPVFAVGANLPRRKGTGKSDFSLAQFRSPERAAKAAGVMYRYFQYRKAIGRE